MSVRRTQESAYSRVPLVLDACIEATAANILFARRTRQFKSTKPNSRDQRSRLPIRLLASSFDAFLTQSTLRRELEFLLFSNNLYRCHGHWDDISGFEHDGFERPIVML
jgi:hypothetical protein